jgi:membrane protein DedA with SNARE-associated domain
VRLATSGAERADLTGLVGLVADVIAALGPLGVGLFVAVENLFPPIPSEVVLPFAGSAASQGEMSLWWALAAATIGSLGGAVVLYELGRAVGLERMRAVLIQLPLVDADEIGQAEAWFARHESSAVLTGRFLPIVRSLVSLPAGAARMSRPRFLALTALGSGMWNTLWLGGGYLLGSEWQQLEDYSGWLDVVLVGGFAVGAVSVSV